MALANSLMHYFSSPFCFEQNVAKGRKIHGSWTDHIICTDSRRGHGPNINTRYNLKKLKLKNLELKSFIIQI